MKRARHPLAFAMPLCILVAHGQAEPPAASSAPRVTTRADAGATTQPAVDTVLISDLLDLSAACGASSCDRGVHGGTQSRICHTSHGAYAVYLGEDKGGGSVFHLVRMREGTATLLHTIPTTVSGSNGVHVLCDAKEDVYVLAAGSLSVNSKERASLGVYRFNRKTGTVTEHSASIPFDHGSSFGYSSACIDPVKNRIHAVYSGGDAPGYFAWFTFDLVTMTWLPAGTVTDLEYRHCYNYCFTNGLGGMVILSERDVTNAAAGITKADTNRKINANYVWDELRLFDIGSLASPAYTAVDVEKAVYDKRAGLYPNVQNNYRGDTFIDAAGNLHVLYMSEDNNHKAGSFLRHAVFNARRALVHNELLEFQGDYMMRMAQSTDGVHYLIAMPYKEIARVQLWRATDAKGLHYKLLKEKRLDTKLAPTYAGLAVSCPRNGSRQDDVIDCLFPVNHHYYYFGVTFMGGASGSLKRQDTAQRSGD